QSVFPVSFQYFFNCIAKHVPRNCYRRIIDHYSHLAFTACIRKEALVLIPVLPAVLEKPVYFFKISFKCFAFFICELIPCFCNTCL
ncbi:MAG: hypothetical protein IJL97_01210, partial [Lachnospiraceae bacterium]|nr:hypothetical protein [Lachnospiraceae bacterium]